MATPNNTISPGLHPPGQQLNANEEEEEMCFVVPKQTKREPVLVIKKQDSVGQYTLALWRPTMRSPI